MAIHAAKRWTREEKEIICEEPFRSKLLNVSNYLRPLNLTAEELEAEELRLWGMDAKNYLPFGAIVAVVRLLYCAPTDILYSRLAEMGRADELAFGDYGTGRWGWVFRDDIHILRNPIPYRGEQGLFEVPDDLIAEALAR